jgi:hypothetical protein
LSQGRAALAFAGSERPAARDFAGALRAGAFFVSAFAVGLAVAAGLADALAGDCAFSSAVDRFAGVEVFLVLLADLVTLATIASFVSRTGLPVRHPVAQRPERRARNRFATR